MKVLVVGSNFFLDEFKDYFETREFEAFFAKTIVDAMEILAKNKVKYVIIAINSMSDVILLKYLNKNHKDIQVILMANKQFTNFLSILKESEFNVINNPFRFTEISEIINKSSKGEQ
ncbi:MAG: hypothetical protein K8S23_14775 [Candidatus Cloacimonetes bacterium]|nr:hypothetical protein [Candidatus Cloacimonadota bacterium]